MAQQTLQRFNPTGWAPEDVANPYPVYQRYRDNDPVHWSPATAESAGAWYVFGYHDAASVLSSQHFGRSSRVARAGDPAAPGPVPASYETLRRIVQNWLVFMDPPQHTGLRSLVSKEFSPNVVAALRTRIKDIATTLIAELREKSTIDLVDGFAAPFPILVISELLGVPEDLCGWFRECAVSLQEASTARARRGADGYMRAEAAAQELAGYFRQEAQRRRGEDHHDLVSLLVQARDRGEPLTDDEIIGTCIHLLTAGHETTTNLICKSVLALLGNSDVLHELRTHPELIRNAVDELVRYDSPVQMVTRWAYRDEVLHGRDIHRGDKVVLVLGSANRDPLQFPDPDALRLHRGTSRHCGFGLGIHYCLGASLARAEAEIGLTMLLENLPQLSLTDEPVQYADDMVFHGPTRLMLRTGMGTPGLPAFGGSAWSVAAGHEEPMREIRGGIVNRTDNDWGRQAPVVALSLYHRDSDMLSDLVKLPEHGPVARIPHGDGYAWVVSDPALVRSVLKDARFSKEPRHAPQWFVDETGLIGSPQTAAAPQAITSEGKEHARLRKLLMLAFSPARVQTWSATVTSVVDELLDNLEHRAGVTAHNTPVDVVSGLAYPLPLTIICTLLGLPRDVHPIMRNASEDISYGGNPAVRNRGREQLYSTVAELIDHHPDRLADGLITDLLALTRGNPPQATRTEVKSWIPGLILPGHESTASLLSSALYELLMARQQGTIETESIDAVVEETLRLHPPFPLATWRFASCDIALSDIDIPSGAPILVNLAAANHDHHIHPRPDQFVPHRDPVNHVSFGLGAHHCVGAALARLETRTATSAFLRRFPDARIANPDAPATWQSDLLGRRIVTLPVILNSAL